MDASGRDPARWWGALLLLTAAGILAHQILFRPIVGLADNGDFSRVTDHLRLGPSGTSPDDRYFLYVFRSWKTAPSTGRRNLSSEILLAGTARAIAFPFSARGSFDLRWLGALHAALLLGAAAVLWTASRGLPPAARVAAGAFAVFAFTDVGYAAPLNSFYTQAASLVFLFWTAAFAAVALRDGRRRAWPIAAYFSAALLFVASKPQEAAQCIPLAVIGAYLGARGNRRIVAAGTTLLFAASAALYVGTRGDSGFQEKMLYKVVFAEILPDSPDPRGDLAVLGLDRTALRYVGTTPADPNSPFWNPKVRASLFPRLSYRSLLRLYKRRPARAAAELVRKAPAGLELRADFGNFEKEAGFHPGARSAGYSAWTRFRLLGRNRAALFLGLFFGVNLLLAARGGIPATARAGLAALLSTGVLAYLVCTLASSPTDMSRKLYVFHAITDLLIAVDVALVGRAVAARRPTAAGNGSSARL